MWTPKTHLITSFIDAKELLDLEFYNGIVRGLSRMSEMVDGTQVRNDATKIAVSKISRNRRLTTVSFVMNLNTPSFGLVTFFGTDLMLELADAKFISFFGFGSPPQTGAGDPATLQVEICKVVGDVPSVTNTVDVGTDRFREQLSPLFDIDATATSYLARFKAGTMSADNRAVAFNIIYSTPV